MKKAIVMLAATSLAVAAQARAEGFSYTYLDFGFGVVQGTNSGDSKSGTAMGFAWAYEMLPAFYFLMDGGGTFYEVYDPDLDEDVTLSPGVFSLGFGYDRSLAPNLDLTAGVSWDTLSLEAAIYDEFRKARYFRGWGVNLGLRGRIGKKFEWTTVAEYSDVERINSIEGLTLTTRYSVTQRFAMGVDLFLRQYQRDPVDLKEKGAQLTFRYLGADRH